VIGHIHNNGNPREASPFTLDIKLTTAFALRHRDYYHRPRSKAEDYLRVTMDQLSPPPASSRPPSTYTSPACRWAAVCSRDPLADGAFVYLVKSTKIYCRPTCKARLARRANVGFCKYPSEAEAAGYRPCKRCKPELATSMPEDAAVTKVRRLVAQGSGSTQWVNLDDMARSSGLSKWHFHRVFKNVVGMTPIEYNRLRETKDPGEITSDIDVTTEAQVEIVSVYPTSPGTSTSYRQHLGSNASDFMFDEDWERYMSGTSSTNPTASEVSPLELQNLELDFSGYSAFIQNFTEEKQKFL
jgi:methylphosphotriester-DNA--protein-cysteine methyltransferase